MTPENLTAFWKECSLAKPPYIHPKDLPVFTGKERWLLKDDATDFESYLASPRFGAEGDDRLHLSLMPVPYIGNIAVADIVILLLNPGFDYSDYWAETKIPEFRRSMVRNLSQSFDGVDFAFPFLDPQFCWHSGFMWWERKLRSVVQQIAKSRYKGNYLDALRSLSNRLACIELVPYHSVSFGDPKLIELLDSVQAAKRFVQESLIPDTISGRRTVIITRQVKGWGLPLEYEHEHLKIYKGGHTRGAHLTPASEGGKAILRRYGID